MFIHKPHLNVYGGKQEYAIKCFETFSPVFTWMKNRLLLVLYMLNQWHRSQSEFNMPYPQEEIYNNNIYMDITYFVEGRWVKAVVLKIIANLYGKTQVGRVWNDYLARGLKLIGFHQSEIDRLIFFIDIIIFVVYMDGRIFVSPY